MHSLDACLIIYFQKTYLISDKSVKACNVWTYLKHWTKGHLSHNLPRKHCIYLKSQNVSNQNISLEIKIFILKSRYFFLKNSKFTKKYVSSKILLFQGISSENALFFEKSRIFF